jgi:TatA/E family protein of Tat protein translocase
MGPSFPDMIFLFLLALVVFGPKKLPEIGRQVGKLLNELKRASNEFKVQIQTEMDNMEQQEQAQKTLAPAEPPPGAIATLSLKPPPVADSEAGESGEVIDLKPLDPRSIDPEPIDAKPVEPEPIVIHRLEHERSDDDGQADSDAGGVGLSDDSEATNNHRANAAIKATNV